MYRIEIYEEELRSSKQGREILQLIMIHVDEVNRLINHNREVMVTWQRNKGAVFFSKFMGSGFNAGTVINKEEGPVRLSSLIRRMAVVLQDYSSKELSEVIDKYFLLVLEYAENCDSLHGIFKKIRKYE